MGRERKVELGMVNIVLHPHSPDHYVRLLRKAKTRKLVSKWHGERYGLIQSFSESQEEEGAYIGKIATFTHIDLEGQWFDLQAGEAVDDEDLPDVNIPQHLRPSLRNYHFVFYPRNHRMVFETHGVEGVNASPNVVGRFLSKLLNDDLLVEEFGDATVTVEPRVDALEKVLGIARLERLTIVLERPNSDDSFEYEQDVLDRLDRNNAISETNSYRAPKGEALTPDDIVKKEARVAQSNGYVESRGKDQSGRPDQESTKAHPFTEEMLFDSDELNQYPEMLVKKAVQVIKHVIGSAGGS